MRGEELAVRNQAIPDALRRGANVHRVAREAELAAATVRVIAMGGGITLTPAQRAVPDDLDSRPPPTSVAATTVKKRAAPYTPEAFAEHFRAYEGRNAAMVAALRDPDKSVAQVCAQFGVNEGTLLNVGWHHGAWEGNRRPRGPEREQRDAAVLTDIRAGAGVDDLTKRWGLSAAHVANMARRANLPTPAPSRGGRPRHTRGQRRQRDALLAADLTAGMSVQDAADKYDLAPSTVVSYARSHGIRIPRTPRTPAPPSARDQELVRRAADGETFTELAQAFDISRERVRQIVLAQDATTAKDLRAQRAARTRLVREERLALLAADRPDLTYPELAAEVRLPADGVVALLGAVEAARRAPLGEERGFDTPAALREMRRIYRLSGFKPLTASFYDKHRRRYIVGSVSLALKFGSWGDACAAANIRAREPTRRVYDHVWPTERCLAWVGAFLLESTSVKASDFRVWVEARQGPSVATVRHRCGLWGETLRAAAELVTRPGWTPPETPLRAADNHGP